jgi:hypothetical protein
MYYGEFESNLGPNDENIWNYVPGTEFLDPYETDVAFGYFWDGFGKNDLTEDERAQARAEFFFYMDMDEGDFPWEDWREWYGEQ